MEFDSFSGSYSPSLFKIYVKTNSDLNNIFDLSYDEQSTYFHEYFHFIQDTTTVFGIKETWNFYNRIRQMVAYVTNAKVTDIHLPLKNNLAFIEIYEQYLLSQEIFGDKNVSVFGYQLDEIEIVGINSVKRDITSKYEPTILYPQLIIKPKKSDAHYKYWFGAIAIIESMVALIQERFFAKKNYRDLPYRAVPKIIAYRYPGQNVPEEVVFSLCDVSLLSPYPPVTLFEILDLFEKMPENGEVVYDVGMNYINSKWPIWDFFDMQRNGLNGTISELYNHESFENDLLWFIHVIGKAGDLRKADNLFMLRLFREQEPFNNMVINKIRYELGAPEVINLVHKRWFGAPHDLMDKEKQINTIFLSIYQKLHDFLLFGTVKDWLPEQEIYHCRMRNHCLGSKRKMPVNDDCINMPWKKATGTPLCPFGAVYWLNGLTKKSFILT